MRKEMSGKKVLTERMLSGVENEREEQKKEKD